MFFSYKGIIPNLLIKVIVLILLNSKFWKDFFDLAWSFELSVWPDLLSLLLKYVCKLALLLIIKIGRPSDRQRRHREHGAIPFVVLGSCHTPGGKWCTNCRVSRRLPLVNLLLTIFVHCKHPLPPIGSFYFQCVIFVYCLV